jgi:uncharacterized repeat protein (TIGR01451 family)
MKSRFDRLAQSIQAHVPNSLRNLVNGISNSVKLAGTIVLTIVGSLSLASVAFAEGSKELTASGGYRPYMDWRSDVSSGVPRRTTMKVYAKAGETINLASSAAGLSAGSGTINYRNPSGTPGTCGTSGNIANRTQETNGSGIGYTPCTVTVTAATEGVWEIDFISPNPTGTSNPANIVATGNWTQSTSWSSVSAWDITVRSSSGIEIKGRTFANAIAWNMGGLGGAIGVSSLLYALTKDGYQYSIDLNGLDPNGFVFFANNLGFQNGTKPIYRSVQLSNNATLTFPSGYSFQNPNTADTATAITHKLFINPPDPALPSNSGSTWLLNSPAIPPAPSSLTFKGTEGTSSQLGWSPATGILGGNFSFMASDAGSYSITIDINKDGIYGNANDRTFYGQGTTGLNNVFWDGKDGNNAFVPPDTIGFNAQVVMYAGEAHFPLLDAETNTNGLIITRLNQPLGYPATGNSDIHFNDKYSGAGVTDYSICSATDGTVAPCGGTQTGLRSGVGISSSSGAHSFGTNFGDIRGIDTWVYYPSAAASLTDKIVIKVNDLDIQKTDNLTSIRAGSPTTYVITITNKGPSDAVNASFQDTLPASLLNATWTCAVTTGTGSCSSASGSGNTIDTPFNLSKNGIITYTINATVSPTATGTITNTGTAKRPKDTHDPVSTNDTSTDTTTVLPGVGVSGTVWNDLNDSIVIDTLENGTNATGLTVYAVDNLGKVIGKAIVDANGLYSIGGLAPNTSYTLRLSTDGSKTINDTAPTTASLPSGWINTGENKNGVTETTTPGELGVTFITTSFVNYNFGIRNSVSVTPPELILLKRITKINGVTSAKAANGTLIDLTAVVAQPDNPLTVRNESNDATNTGWITNYPKGAIDAGVIKSGDLIEYTIYFLSIGGQPVTNANFCDWVPKNTSFVPDAYGLGRGIQLAIGSILNTFTNVPDYNPNASAPFLASNDRGMFLSPGAAPPTNYPDNTTYKLNCMNPMGVDGAVVVNLVNNALAAPENQLPNATAAGTPGNSYGFVRFVSKVK